MTVHTSSLIFSFYSLIADSEFLSRTIRIQATGYTCFFPLNLSLSSSNHWGQGIISHPIVTEPYMQTGVSHFAKAVLSLQVSFSDGSRELHGNVFTVISHQLGLSVRQYLISVDLMFSRDLHNGAG